MSGLRTRIERAAALGFGVAILCLLVEINPLISSAHAAVYHFDGPAGDLFLPVLLSLFIVWIMMTGLLMVDRGTRLGATIWTGLLLVLPWIAIKDWTIVSVTTLPHWASLPIALLPVSGIVVVNVLWKPRVRDALERMMYMSEIGFYAISVTGVLITGQMLFAFVQARGLNDPSALHTAAVTESHVAGARRIIVILFDELSYEQTYGRRSPRVQLPEFDRLAAEGTVFRNVRPAAEFTDRAVPVLLTGHAAELVRASADGRTMEMKGAQGWARLDPRDTVFADALRAGYRTGVAGWYNPYCRIMPQVLDRCEWHAHASLPDLTVTDTAVSGESLLKNTLYPVQRALQSLPGFFTMRGSPLKAEGSVTDRHVQDYQQIAASADSLLRDQSITFVFLHLPIPHQGGIYDRHTGRQTHTSTSYLDNLALADQYLGHARRLLEQQGEWDDDAVIVLGDHSWRTWMWNGSLFWTDEDTAVIKGQEFDDRPAMVVKLPHETRTDQPRAAHIDTTFEARKTRWLLDELISGRIHTQTELAQWTADEAR